MGGHGDFENWRFWRLQWRWLAALRLAADALDFKCRAVLTLKVWRVQLRYLSSSTSLFESRGLHSGVTRGWPTRSEIDCLGGGLGEDGGRGFILLILLLSFFHSSFYWILFHGRPFDQFDLRLNWVARIDFRMHRCDNSIRMWHQSGHRAKLSIADRHGRVLSYPLWRFGHSQRLLLLSLLLSLMLLLRSSCQYICFHVLVLQIAENELVFVSDLWDDSSF